MTLKDIVKFQLKRINPFQGLVIDADTWKDAHDYHRDQQRLHLLTFHKTGVIEGLESNGNYRLEDYPHSQLREFSISLIAPDRYSIDTGKKYRLIYKRVR